jgi:hypothetical protein
VVVRSFVGDPAVQKIGHLPGSADPRRTSTPTSSSGSASDGGRRARKAKCCAFLDMNLRESLDDAPT